MFNHFDFIAPAYDFLIGSRPSKRLTKFLKYASGGMLLDAGGGTGRICAHFRSNFRRIVVSDLSFPMLREARKKGGLLASLSHVEQLCFSDSVFDQIIVVDALHHFCDQQKAIRELSRVLKRGGKLVIEEPDIELFPVKAVEWIENFLKMQSRFLTPVRIHGLLIENGMTARIEKTKAFRTLIVADKQ